MYPVNHRMLSSIRKTLTLLLIAVILSGCAFRTDFTLYADEGWEFVSVIILTAACVASKHGGWAGSLRCLFLQQLQLRLQLLIAVAVQQPLSAAVI